MVLLSAIDQGTSSSRFLVYESDTGELVTSHQIEVRQIFPRSGWVEMNPREIFDTVNSCIQRVCENLESMNISIEEISSIGISNQRETTVVWDRATGKALYNAIVWLDTRTEELAEESINNTPTKDQNYFKDKTGLPIHPYFSALKLKWLFNNVSEVKEAYERGTLLFGTVDSWIIWKMTGHHVTDVSNASRTLLLDLHKRKWSTELCEFFEIPQSVLPKIMSSAEIYGYMDHGPLKGVPISGCLGDQQAAMVGHNCLKIGDTKSTYGTGTFMLCNIGSKPIISKDGLLTTVGFQFGSNSPICYALEGSGSIGGNVVRFLRDNFGFIRSAAEIEDLAKTVEDTNDVYFVPCFAGLYTPHWDSTARGTICGLTQCSNKAHIARAALKAIAFQTVEMAKATENDLENGNKIEAFKVDGGMTANKLFNQMLADTLGRTIVVSKMAEISGFGSAIAAGIGAGTITLDAFKSLIPKTVEYVSKIDNDVREAEMRKWENAVLRARKWTTKN
uniref:Glycerol kinase n=1 Tax=Panagrolaimus sp. PS1159 TaxID=55785 RepID=A0AC35F4S0_9BILA